MNIYSYTSDYQKDLLIFLEKLHQEIGESLDFMGKDSDLDNIEESYMGHRQGFWFCLNPGGGIIGTIAIRKQFDQELEYAEIRRLYVSPSERSKGLGRILMLHAFNFAKENGYKLLRGTTSFKRDLAIEIFEHYGASRISPYRDSDADIFFEKVID